MMKPITQYSQQIVNGNNLSEMVRESFKIAQYERPGVVHLELPEDIAIEEVDEQVFHVHRPRYPMPREKGIQRAVDMLYQAKMPLVLIGAGAN